MMTQRDHPANEQAVFTVTEAAQYLRVGRNILYAAIKKKEIPAVYIGRSIRISRVALDRWLEQSQRGGP